MIKLGVLGAGGRMGRRIIELALNDKELEVILALERKGHHLIGKNIDKVKISSTPDGIFLADAIIDFTIPEASMENLAYVLQYKKPLVLATTGFNEEQTAKIRDAAKSIAIVFSPNMSIGINLLFDIVGEIAKKLGPGYDIEMVEAHHKAKKDAPSGTAKKLAQVIANDTARIITVHAVRAGDIIGDHTVIYAGMGERIEIKHQAHSRDVFVLGALKAVKWVAKKPPAYIRCRMC